MTGTLSRGIFLAMGILFGMTAVQAQAQTMASVVMDARTGKILQATNGTTRVHPASLTKMMTLYIAFDQLQKGQLSLDRKVTVSANAAAEPPSRLGLREGQQIEVRYLIRAAAIKSANDAATALGEVIGGSEANFAKMMNAYARAMGMDNTTFRNANGLTAEGHMSSARDMAMLGRRLVYDFPQYYNIFSRNSTSAGLATVRNTNRRLLDAYPGADGIKTGYTKAAGFNLVSSAKRGDKRVIVALLGGRSSAARNAEVARLMDVGFAKMPARARQVPLVALNVPGVRIARTQVAAATNATLLDAPDAPLTLVRGSTAGVADGPGEDQMDEEDALAAAESPTAAAPVSVVATKGTADGMLPILRPRPRAAAFAGVGVARQRETIAAALSGVDCAIAAPRPPPGRPGELGMECRDRRSRTRHGPPGAPPGWRARRRDERAEQQRLDLCCAASCAAPRCAHLRTDRCTRWRRGGERGRRNHRRQRLGRAARRLPRQGRGRAPAPDDRAPRRSRAQRRPPPGRGREGPGRHRLPRPVRRPVPAVGSQRLRRAGPAEHRMHAARPRDLTRTPFHPA